MPVNSNINLKLDVGGKFNLVFIFHLFLPRKIKFDIHRFNLIYTPMLYFLNTNSKLYRGFFELNFLCPI